MDPHADFFESNKRKRDGRNQPFKLAVKQGLERNASTCVANWNDMLKFFVEHDDGSSALESALLNMDPAYIEDSLLLRAVQVENEKGVKVLLFSGKPFSKSFLQQSLLEAIRLHSPELVACLLNKGTKHINPNFWVDEDSQLTPLHLSASQDEIALLLLQAGANPNARDMDGQSPLHVVGGNHVSARWMIQYGADPNLRDKHGNTSLHMACHAGSLATVKELHYANPDLTDDNEQTPLHDACRRGSMPIIRWLIKVAKADPTPPTSVPPLEYAACHGKLMPKELIELGLDPRQGCPESGTIAHSILRFENKKLDENKFRLRFMDELLQCDPTLVSSLDRFQSTPLHWCQSPDMVRLLVEKFNADLMQRNRGGRTPLIESVFVSDNEHTVEAFLQLYTERGLDIDLPDKNGWSSLHHAVFHGHADYVKLLMDYGADKDRKNGAGRSPLHLVGYSFSPGRRMDSFRDSDISCAMRKPCWVEADEADYTDCVEVLLLNGANAVILDDEQNLPFFLAASLSRVTETFRMIQQAAGQGLFD